MIIADIGKGKQNQKPVSLEVSIVSHVYYLALVASTVNHVLARTHTHSYMYTDVKSVGSNRNGVNPHLFQAITIV